MSKTRVRSDAIYNELKATLRDPNTNDNTLGRKILTLSTLTKGTDASLFEYRALKNAMELTDKDGNTLLHLAAVKGFRESLIILAAAGGNPAKQNERNVTPFLELLGWCQTNPSSKEGGYSASQKLGDVLTKFETDLADFSSKLQPRITRLIEESRKEAKEMINTHADRTLPSLAERTAGWVDSLRTHARSGSDTRPSFGRASSAPVTPHSSRAPVYSRANSARVGDDGALSSARRADGRDAVYQKSGGARQYA